MQIFRRWVAARGRATALVASVAVFTGIQISGYGTQSNALDLACALILVGVAGAFHFHFIDGIARFEREADARDCDPVQSVQQRIDVTIIGICTFLFSAMSIVMLVRSLAG
jgi:hypothetical protein